MKPGPTRVRISLLSFTLLACGASLTSCDNHEPEPQPNPVTTGMPPTTASNPQSPMSDGLPAGTPNTTP